MDEERKPVITYSGDAEVFRQLQNGLVAALGEHKVEWRRPGHQPCHVTLEAGFEPLTDASLGDDLSSLRSRPCLHTHWLCAVDADVYKSSSRPILLQWLSRLRNANVLDWMVVVVVAGQAMEARAKTAAKLLPRTTVLDRVKQDVLSKHSDRCVSLLDPSRSDSRSSDSWRQLLSKMRQFLMTGLNRCVVRYEANVKAQRDTCSRADWCLGSHFVREEELALFFRQLELPEEALARYDQLQQLVTRVIDQKRLQVKDGMCGPFPTTVTAWHGIHTPYSSSAIVRQKIASGNISYLEFRNYLLARQCSILERIGDYQQIAARACQFVFNTKSELHSLQIAIPQGGLQCWLLTVCLYVLKLCSESLSEPTVHLAILYDQARLHLYELAVMCGLISSDNTSSSPPSLTSPSPEQLLHSNSLLAGCQPPPPPSSADPRYSAVLEQLLSALSSSGKLVDCYLELAEVATGTYKHVGRHRTARAVGCDLAQVQLATDKVAHAASLLSDAFSQQLSDNWQQFAALHTAKRLLHCLHLLGDADKYIQVCAALANCDHVDQAVRLEYVQLLSDVLSGHTTISADKPPANNTGDDNNSETPAEVSKAPPSRVNLTCRSLLHVQTATAGALMTSQPSVELYISAQVVNSSSRSLRVTRAWTDIIRCSSNKPSRVDGDSSFGVNPPQIALSSSYCQDRTLNAVSIVCCNAASLLRRKDSVPILALTSGSVGNNRTSASTNDTTFRLTLSETTTVNPGTNTLHFSHTTDSDCVGQYMVKSITLEVLTAIVHVPFSDALYFRVDITPLQVEISFEDDTLLAGIPQRITLSLKCGSCPLPNGGQLSIHCSNDLQLAPISSLPADNSSEPVFQAGKLALPVPPLLSGDTAALSVLLLSCLRSDVAAVEQKLTMSCVEAGLNEQERTLNFCTPFSVKHTLHTTGRRKFLQVEIVGNRWCRFILSSARLSVTKSAHALSLQPLHELPPESSVVVSDMEPVSYMWELSPTTNAATADADSAGENQQQLTVGWALLTFTVLYRTEREKQQQQQRQEHSVNISLTNCDTLFSVSYDLTSSTSSTSVSSLSSCPPLGCPRSCRIGQWYRFCVCIDQLVSGQSSIMYELIVDQHCWAVCGESSGVLNADGTPRKHELQIDLMPLSAGTTALPSVRLSKYFPPSKEAVTGTTTTTYGGIPRVEPFSVGQVYNVSRGMCVHVQSASTTTTTVSAVHSVTA